MGCCAAAAAAAAAAAFPMLQPRESIRSRRRRRRLIDRRSAPRKNRPQNVLRPRVFSFFSVFFSFSPPVFFRYFFSYDDAGITN